VTVRPQWEEILRVVATRTSAIGDEKGNVTRMNPCYPGSAVGSGALRGSAVSDELEGMLAAQLIAAHKAVMECYRRAMLAAQTFEGTYCKGAKGLQHLPLTLRP
jgi:hypothetical protein